MLFRSSDIYRYRDGYQQFWLFFSKNSYDLCNVRCRFGGSSILRTIFIGTCVAIQGQFVRQLDNGNIVIRVGDQTYEGKPANKAA